MHEVKRDAAIRKIIVELLSMLGSSREARQYLQRFSAIDQFQFAVIKVGGGVLDTEADELAGALAFLRHAGLYPITVHGAGPQLNAALAAAGVAAQVVDGLRVTTPEVMKIVRPVIYRQNMKLVEALERHGVRARSLTHGVFDCDVLDRRRYGWVGQVREVRIEVVQAALAAHALPIVACLGESDSGQVLNLNADSAARALVAAIRPYKIIYLTPTGGLLDANGRVLEAINLATDYERLMSSDWVHSGMRLKLQEIKTLLDALPASASVSITSAAHLTRELFTHAGAGTLIRRGETILPAAPLQPPDQPRLAELIESCFGRRLNADYFAGLQAPRLVRNASWTAAAVLTEGLGQAVYMDKFAVTREAQGEGIGAALWRQIRREAPRLYWRSRADNPINGWYLQQASQVIRGGQWLAFCYGDMAADSAADCLNDALARPACWQPQEAAA